MHYTARPSLLVPPVFLIAEHFERMKYQVDRQMSSFWEVFTFTLDEYMDKINTERNPKLSLVRHNA